MFLRNLLSPKRAEIHNFNILIVETVEKNNPYIQKKQGIQETLLRTNTSLDIDLPQDPEDTSSIVDTATLHFTTIDNDTWGDIRYGRKTMDTAYDFVILVVDKENQSSFIRLNPTIAGELSSTTRNLGLDENRVLLIGTFFPNTVGTEVFQARVIDLADRLNISRHATVQLTKEALQKHLTSETKKYFIPKGKNLNNNPVKEKNNDGFPFPAFFEIFFNGEKIKPTSPAIPAPIRKNDSGESVTTTASSIPAPVAEKQPSTHTFVATSFVANGGSAPSVPASQDNDSSDTSDWAMVETFDPVHREPDLFEAIKSAKTEKEVFDLVKNYKGKPLSEAGVEELAKTKKKMIANYVLFSPTLTRNIKIDICKEIINDIIPEEEQKNTKEKQEDTKEEKNTSSLPLLSRLFAQKRSLVGEPSIDKKKSLLGQVYAQSNLQKT
ncbi:MAG TPA: hypothetical protein VHZ76_10660 [Gammaproteobacteria bacterium]|jgi:hypothetical protein|nr:hypothetical protein [Gammaproteobacteria bacterium]